jgi:hypothetical protein
MSSSLAPVSPRLSAPIFFVSTFWLNHTSARLLQTQVLAQSQPPSGGVQPQQSAAQHDIQMGSRKLAISFFFFASYPEQSVAEAVWLPKFDDGAINDGE